MKPWERRAEALSRRAPKGARIAEIGFGVGKMARALAAMRPDIHLTMVDSFLPGDQQPARYRETRDNFAVATLDQADARHRDALALAVEHGWALYVGDSVEAAGALGEFDVVFVDADHSYEGVRRDLAAWLPKARLWIGGHDYRNPDPRFDFSGVERAVTEVFGAVDLDSNFTWWARR